MRVRWLVVFWGLAACGRIGFTAEERIDAEPPVVEPCDPRTDATTVALYSFETSVTADTTTRHDATMIGTVDKTPGACLTGASFAGGTYLLVPDSSAFDLPEGSIELFARVVNPLGGQQALLSRDAGNQDLDGHLTIGVAPSGQLIVRLQRIDRTVLRCTEAAIPADQW